MSLNSRVSCLLLFQSTPQFHERWARGWVVLSCHLRLNHHSPFLAPTMGLEGLELVMDRPEHVRGDLYLLTAAGCNGGSGVPKSSLPDPHRTLFCAVPVKGWCWVLLFAGLCSDQWCLTERSVTPTLTLSLICHLGSALRPSLSFRFHLMETTIFRLPPRGFFGENRMAKASQLSQARLSS